MEVYLDDSSLGQNEKDLWFYTSETLSWDHDRDPQQKANVTFWLTGNYVAGTFRW